jgi:adenylylsulfate kinase
MNFCLWITGLPGSGKSTIAEELKHVLSEKGVEVIALSLDQIRKTLTPEPKYTDEERGIVYRSIVLMAQHLVEYGEKNIIIDATGNRREFRDFARELIPEFAEVYIKCPLTTCQMREASRKGQAVEENLYRRATQGHLKGQLPGISAPYDVPENPEVQVDSSVLCPRESAGKIMAYIESRWTTKE